MKTKNILPFIEVDVTNEIFPPKKAFPLKGYEAHANNSVANAKFPYCCKLHKDIFENCLNEYKTDDKKELSLKVTYLVSFTEYFINVKKTEDNWLAEIMDYIQYCIVSFGQPKKGVDEYLHYIQYIIKNEIDFDEKAILLEHIEENYFTETKKTVPDIITLKQIYENWLNLFPFDISYFTELKKHFNSKLPLFKGTIHTNKYTGLSQIEIISEDELLNFIKDQTVKLLQLVREHPIEIEDKEQHIFELLNQAHQIKQDRLLNGYSKKESDYIVILEQWLNNEKEYFKEANQYFKHQTQKSPLLNPRNFKDIFIEDDYNKYIELLKNANPKLVNNKLEYIGSIRTGKGIIGSWIKELQTKGKVYTRYNRRQLAIVINNEIKGLNIGVDGKTLDNRSKTFEKIYEKQLFPND